MKYKIKQSGKTQKIVEFHISKELVSEELDRLYRDISKTASLPGFRTGKVPIGLIKKRYKKEATDEVVKSLLTGSFKKAVSESDIDMLGLPKITDLEFHEDKGMSYKATVDIRPQVKIKKHKGLNLKKLENEVKESDVDKEIDNLRSTKANFSTKEGSAEEGDYVICDVECVVEGKSLEKKENAWLYVGEPAFIPSKTLKGMKANDQRDVEKAFPKEYSKKEIAGKNAKFHITAKEIKKKVLPELNDEFARTAANLKTMAELREALRKNIKRRNEIERRRALESEALKLLGENTVFEAPKFMVEKQFEILMNDTREKLKRQQLPKEEIESMEKNFSEKLKIEAAREVRAFFILEEIAKLENITVGDEEINAAFKEIASSSGHSADEVEKYYNENNLLENLREDIKQKKALDFVIKNANLS